MLIPVEGDKVGIYNVLKATTKVSKTNTLKSTIYKLK